MRLINREFPPGAQSRVPIEWRGLSFIILAAYLILLICTGWLSDDAYITLRTVDNFIHGFGLRWNIDERVQTYTHPLWMLYLSILYFFTREAYYTTVAGSILVAMAALFVFLRTNRTIMAGTAFAALILLCSRAFIDFSTSGLENPLAALLFFSFAAIYFREHFPRQLFFCCLLASLGMLNRLDSALIYFPCLFKLMTERQKWRDTQSWLSCFLGFFPLFAWELFSLWYYGFAFPNTAYAKIINGQIETRKILSQGIYYFFQAFTHDAATWIGLVLGCTLGLLSRRCRDFMLTTGVLLYLCYILIIGGDFMAGRFFFLPLVASVCLIARLFPLRRPKSIAFAAAALLLACMMNPINNWSVMPKHGDPDIVHRIADERGFYFFDAGLLKTIGRAPIGRNERANLGRSLARQHTTRYLFSEAVIGYLGYYAGPHIHIFDYLGICDPIVARMPMKYKAGFRPGHIYRQIPAGYYETLKTESNQLTDPGLHLYYDQLKTIANGPLFSKKRLRAIWSINCAAAKAALKGYNHFDSMARHAIPLHLLSQPKVNGYDYLSGDVLWFGRPGLLIDLEGMRHNEKLNLSLDSNDTYQIEFYHEQKMLGVVKILPTRLYPLRTYECKISPEIYRAGFDNLRIRPIDGDDRYALGHVSLL